MKETPCESDDGFYPNRMALRRLPHLFIAVSTAITLLTSASTALAIQPDEEVFYPIPQNIALPPNEHPTPTQDLLDNADYVAADADDVMTINAYVYKPDPDDFPAPYPTVILLHGSSSVWSDRKMWKGISFQYREWAEELTERGYMVIMPDSYHLRGIPSGFSGRFPSDDPADDDALCSPNYERPKDVVATLAYLDSRNDVDTDNIGILSFSHGAQTALNSILDPGIDLSPYTENCKFANSNNEYDRDAPDPVRIPNNLPFPKVVVAYYPGCGFNDYHGSPNDTGANRYMPDPRTKVLMAHGTDDILMNNEFPVKLVAASRAHAFANAFADPFIYHYIFEDVDHSFDNYSVKIEPEANWWDPQFESPTEAAKRITRKEALRQFGHRLKGEPYLITPAVPMPGDVDSKFPGDGSGGTGGPVLTWNGKNPELEWPGEDGLGFQLMWYPSRGEPVEVSPLLLDEGRGFTYSFDLDYLLSGDLFLEKRPGVEAWMDWRNTGLLRYDPGKTTGAITGTNTTSTATTTRSR